MTFPGTFPGTFSGAFPGTFPGTLPGAFPGTLPGAFSGGLPVGFPGAFPGAFQDSFSRANAFPGQLPPAFRGTLSGSFPNTYPFSFPVQSNRAAPPTPRAVPAVHYIEEHPSPRRASLPKKARATHKSSPVSNSTPFFDSAQAFSFGSTVAFPFNPPPALTSGPALTSTSASTRTSSSASTQTSTMLSAMPANFTLASASASNPSSLMIDLEAGKLHIDLEAVQDREAPQSSSPKTAKHLSTKSNRRPADIRPNSALNLPMVSLKIGCFTVEGDQPSKVGWKFKVVFSKKRFMYEFEKSSAPDDNGSRSTCVIVPFQAVFALRCEKDHVTLQMEFVPVMFLGRRNSEDRPSSVTMLANLAMHLDYYPVHKVQLSAEDVDRVKRRLWDYSPRFQDLMRRPICGEDTKLQHPLPPYGALARAAMRGAEMGTDAAGRKVQQAGRRRTIRYEPDTTLVQQAAAVTTGTMCSCRFNCRGMRCPCVRARRHCEPGGCACISCDNPLNFLSSVGIELDRAREDACLMQGVYKVGDLAAYLRQQVRLTCCSESVTVRDCIPGPIKCPSCAAPAEFSWCADTLFHGPTNHCSKCMRCNLFAGAHCKKCNSCYYFGLGSNGCPKCEPFEQALAEGPDLAKTQAILAQCAFPAQLRPSRVQRSGPRPLLPKPAQAPQQQLLAPSPGVTMTAHAEDSVELLDCQEEAGLRSTDTEATLPNSPELQEHQQVDIDVGEDDICQASSRSST